MSPEEITILERLSHEEFGAMMAEAMSGAEPPTIDPLYLASIPGVVEFLHLVETGEDMASHDQLATEIVLRADSAREVAADYIALMKANDGGAALHPTTLERAAEYPALLEEYLASVGALFIRMIDAGRKG